MNSSWHGTTKHGAYLIRSEGRLPKMKYHYKGEHNEEYLNPFCSLDMHGSRLHGTALHLLFAQPFTHINLQSNQTFKH